MIRVLHLRSGSGLYGAERTLLALATRTPAPFVAEVGSLCRSVDADVLAIEARRQGLGATSFVSRSASDFSAVDALAHMVRVRRFALLHAHDYKSLVFACLAAARTRCAVVATYHGHTRVTMRVRAWEALGCGIGNLTCAVAAVSRPLTQELKRWIRFAPIRYLPNGIPLPRAIDPEERQRARAMFGIAGPTLAVIGRLSPEKGHPVLLKALKAMRTTPTVLVAGDGPSRTMWERAAQRRRIRLLGVRDDVRPVYAASDLVVLPSLTEGLPLVALEAMAHGLPLVASSVGDLPGLCSDGAGELVPPASPRALAETLDRIVGSPGLRRRLSEAGRIRVRSAYSAEAMAARYAQELYAPALERGARSI